ncbi:MAG TPA: hypothetical protein VEU32_08835 [Burkholderiales bacterium]|nr:hypothetical protein [Burkholderiales bacterium]
MIANTVFRVEAWFSRSASTAQALSSQQVLTPAFYRYANVRFGRTRPRSCWASDVMMNMDGMGSMVGWMMGWGVIGWLLVIGLLVAIVALLWRLVDQRSVGRDPDGHRSDHRSSAPR